MGIYPVGGPAPGGGRVEAASDGGTLIMESPAAAHDDAYPPKSQSPRTAPKPFGQTVPFGVPPSPHQPQQFHDPRAMSPQEAHGGDMIYAAPAARSAPIEPPRGNRILVFIGVAVVTMVVVIVAGLVILAVSD
jgi:hypothetical protein